MRVVAGTARGRRLRSPDGETTRPTSDRVREAVFNALHSQGLVQDARIADLFAGSGALGIEALSRGAAHVWFVESDRGAQAVIDDNLRTLDLADDATVIRSTVDRALAPAFADDLDVVLADPPYAFDGWEELCAAVAPMLVDDGLLVAESGEAITLPAGWEKMRERTYGGTVITFALPPRGDPPEPAFPDDRSGADA
ncbi:16S rRNA (guanine(966)-N(2))-methyltransferase RsmD [Actinospongicola halichondriae]|uniref:16S rRNA (guanine(966)-N(2))-methyltransferase RsmD n=1 Tax=Actinospongicola halichondriae TaxID=3236844 RepID=UPI003D5C12D5